jgi:phosphoglycerol geranylgeranyltransferase
VKQGRVWSGILEKIAEGPVHMTLMDPASTDGATGGKIAAEAARLGTHAIMVGGSTDVTRENLDALVAAVKDATDVPVILFPSSARALSPHVDAVYFLSTLNSTDPRIIVGEQAKGAPLIRRARVETIGMGYVIVEPGMKAGRVSEANPIPRTPDGVTRALGYALAAQYFGMATVYLEAGSGAPSPVPAEMIRVVKGALDIPLVVGGGVRSASAAGTVLDAGADVLVTGTIAENGDFTGLENVIREVHARRDD